MNNFNIIDQLKQIIDSKIALYYSFKMPKIFKQNNSSLQRIYQIECIEGKIQIILLRKNKTESEYRHIFIQINNILNMINRDRYQEETIDGLFASFNINQNIQNKINDLYIYANIQKNDNYIYSGMMLRLILNNISNIAINITIYTFNPNTYIVKFLKEDIQEINFENIKIILENFLEKYEYKINDKECLIKFNDISANEELVKKFYILNSFIDIINLKKELEDYPNIGEKRKAPEKDSEIDIYDEIFKKFEPMLKIIKDINNDNINKLISSINNIPSKKIADYNIMSRNIKNLELEFLEKQEKLANNKKQKNPELALLNASELEEFFKKL